MALTKIKRSETSKVKLYQILIPVFIGLAVVVGMFLHEFENSDFGKLPPFSPIMVWSLIAGFGFVFCRDFFMTLRFRIVTNHQLSWKQALRVCLLCEFTSAITPSTVGGSAVGMLFMNKEGVNLGRATTLMLITIFLDELFFVVSCPLVLLITPLDQLFGSLSPDFTKGIRIAFWAVYGIIAAWTMILFTGIILKPQLINKIIVVCFKLPILRKWNSEASKFASNMIDASVEAKSMSAAWWLKTFFATAMSWMSRYLLVCALFLAFVPMGDQWLVFARQCVVWLVLMVSPTPGGSGLSEWLFTQYYIDLVSSGAVALFIALVWRILSYYIYLIIGVVLIPAWVKKLRQQKTNGNPSK